MGVERGPPSAPYPFARLEREYVWSPGDWGVDELLVQYDQGRRASWPLQDAGGDVIALCDLGGTSDSAPCIVVAERGTFVHPAFRPLPASWDLTSRDGVSPAQRLRRYWCNRFTASRRFVSVVRVPTSA